MAIFVPRSAAAVCCNCVARAATNIFRPAQRLLMLTICSRYGLPMDVRLVYVRGGERRKEICVALASWLCANRLLGV